MATMQTDKSIQRVGIKNQQNLLSDEDIKYGKKTYHISVRSKISPEILNLKSASKNIFGETPYSAKRA